MSAKNEEAQNNLPQSLGKLEIVPSVTKDQDHLVTSVKLNPFSIRNSAQDISLTEREKLFGPSCNCSQTNRTTTTTNKEFPVKKCSQFKPKKRNEFILKQPKLKDIARCLHQCQKEMTNTLSGNKSNSHLSEVSEDEMGCNWSLRSDFDVDFKSLNLSETVPSTSAAFDLHKSYSFRYPQSERKLDTFNDQSPISMPNDRTNQQSISCSQQAMLNSSQNSDVTTDELACYFETMVHIPKKMSTMAEMMYI